MFRFKENYEDYQRIAYLEAALRTEFIDPFFECLGWDVYNRSDKAESYKDVQREVRIDVEEGKERLTIAFDTA